MSFIVAIGGARGSGKSALARMLSNTLRTDVLHLGRVRGLLRGTTGHDPILDRSVNREAEASESVATLTSQSRAMKSAVDHVIAECRVRQAPLVIEGTHCLPGLYREVDVHVILNVENATLAARYGKDKIRADYAPLPCFLTPMVARNLQIQAWLLEAAVRFENHVSIIEADYLPAAFIEIVQKIPSRRIPRLAHADTAS